MVDLGLSDQQIAASADVSTGTIRKIMGGSEREPSARLLRAIYRYFQEVAAERGIPLDKPPGLDFATPSAVATDPLLAALAAQTAAINKLINRLDLLLPSERVREMLAWAAEHMPAQSPSPDPKPEHDGSPAR